MMEHGHTTGTATAESVVPQGLQRGAGDRQSSALGWPRLLSLEQAAAYIGMSTSMLTEYIHDGSLPVTRPTRAKTDRAYGIRAGRRTRRAVASEQVRRLLIDRNDLDALVDRWKREQSA